MNKKVINTSLLALVMSTQVTPLIISATEITSSNNAENNVVTSTDGNVSSKSTDATTNVISDDKTLDPVKEASTTDATEEASTTDATEEASTTDATEEASTTDATEEASTTDAAEEASTTDATEEASTTDATEEASTTDAAEEASTTDATEEASTTDATEEASTTDATEEASTMDATEEASATDATEEASSTDATEEASTTDVTEEASTTDATEEASTTDATEEASTTDAGQNEKDVLSSLKVSLEPTDGLSNAKNSKSLTLSKNQDLSSDKNKEENNAGSKEIKFNNKQPIIVDTEADENQTQVLDTTGKSLLPPTGVEAKELSSEDVNTKLKSLEKGQFIVGDNGEIIASNASLFQTIGGYDHITYMYPSLEAAASQKDGRSINGGAFDGFYFGTEYYEGKYYAHIFISGYDGYMNLSDIQIIPNNVEVNQSYYANENGSWVYNEATDPLVKDSYEKLAIGTAPSWAKSGTKYYSYDDSQYVTTAATNSSTDETPYDAKASVNVYSPYFLNLPFRSTSNYTAAQYKSFLASKGATGAKYYNATQAFVDAQNQLGINSLWLLAQADHESAYGSSQLANTCNAFFGRGAIDSDPSQGCVWPNGWPTAYDGIMAQAVFLTYAYADVNDWKFFGIHPGDKQSGIGAVYASDVNYGKVLANHMYYIDSYLGGKEEGKYRIYSINSTQTTFKDSGLTTKQYQSGTGMPGNVGRTEYKVLRNINSNYGQTAAARPRVVVTDENSKAFEYQMHSARSKASDGYIKWNMGYSGTWPNFAGWIGGCSTCNSANYVYKGDVNFFAPYGSAKTKWTDNQGWFPKFDAYGNRTYSVIYDTKAVNPGNETNSIVTPPDSASTLKTSARNESSLKGTKLDLQGVGYLDKVNMPKTTDISNKLNFINNSTNKVYKTVSYASTASHASELNSYEKGDGRQYDAGWFASPGYKGIDLSSFANGTYRLNMKTCSTKNSSICDTDDIYAGELNGKTFKQFVNGRQYSLFGNNEKVYISIYNIPDTTPKIKTNATKFSLNNAKLNIEGAGYLQGVSTPKSTDIQHTLRFVNSSGTTKQTTKIGASVNSNMMNKYESDGRNYNAGNFKPYSKNNYQIDLSSLPNGTYKVYMDIEKPSTKARGTEQLYSNTLKDHEVIGYNNGKSYELFAQNNRVMLEVGNYKDIRTSAKGAKMSGSKMRIEGPAYLYNQVIDQTTDVQHFIQFYKYDTRSESSKVAYKVGAQNKHSIMSEYGNNGKNNDAGYLIPYTKDDNYLNLSGLPKGKYKVYAYARLTSNTSYYGHEWLYAGSINGKTFKTTSAGRTYTLSTVNNRVVLTIS